MVRLNRTYYSLLKFTSKIFKIVSPSQIPANYVNSTQFAPHSLRIPQNPHILHYVSGTCPGREPCKIPANYANSAILLTYFTLCFRHLPRQRTLQNSSELRKFCAVRPYSPRTTRNSHILLTYSTLCFRHLPQQRMLSNSSELRKFRTIRPHSPRITRNSHHLLTLHLMFQMPDQWQTTP